MPLGTSLNNPMLQLRFMQENEKKEYYHMHEWHKDWQFLIDAYRMAEKDPAKEAHRLKYWYRKQETLGETWFANWAWFIAANKKLQDEIRIAYGTKVEVDPRNPKPFPDTTNKVYGWLVGRPEFRLEKYGPDVEPVPELPDLYKIK